MNETIEKPTTALTVTQRAAVALGASKAREELTAMVLKSKDVLAINSPAGREEAHGYAMALVKARTAITKIGKEAREDAAKFGKAVIAEENALIAITSPEEARLLALRDAWDAKVAAEKEAKAQAERVRIAGHMHRIDVIKHFYAMALEYRESAMVQLLIKDMGDKLEQGFADYEEFAGDAQAACSMTLEKVQGVYETKLAAEAEAARVKLEQEAAAAQLAKERAELAAQQEAARVAMAKLQAEADATAKKLADEITAQRKALADELAASQARMDKERAELAGQQAKVNAARLALENEQRAAKEAADKAEYEAAIYASNQALAPVDIAQAAIETVAEPVALPSGQRYSTTTFKDNGEPILLNADGTRSIFCDIADDAEPATVPTAREMIYTVAEKYNTDPATAAQWLADAAGEIANFEG